MRMTLCGFAPVCGRYACDDAWKGPGEDGRATIKFVVPPGQEASQSHLLLALITVGIRKRWFE